MRTIVGLLQTIMQRPSSSSKFRNTNGRQRIEVASTQDFAVMANQSRTVQLFLDELYICSDAKTTERRSKDFGDTDSPNIFEKRTFQRSPR